MLHGLPALLGPEWLVPHSYLAGVDATHWVSSTQVLSVDGPCVPEAAVTELGINDVDLGLLQDIAWSFNCEHRKKQSIWQLLGHSLPLLGGEALL